MLRLIVFAIIIVWIVVRIARAVPKDERAGDQAQPDRKKTAGRKYSWVWMQAAGALGLKFIRPESGNGYPAIRGTAGGIEVTVQCLPPVPYNDPYTVYVFRFPLSAQSGMKLLLTADAEELKRFARGRDSWPLQEILGEKCNAPDYFLEADDAERLKRYLSRECLDTLCSMTAIYPRILLTDSELQITARGDPGRCAEFPAGTDRLAGDRFGSRPVRPGRCCRTAKSPRTGGNCTGAGAETGGGRKIPCPAGVGGVRIY